MASQNNGEPSSSGSQPPNEQLQGLGIESTENFNHNHSARPKFGAGPPETRDVDAEDGRAALEGDSITPQELAKHARNVAAAAKAREEISEEAIAARGIHPDLVTIAASLKGEQLQSPQRSILQLRKRKVQRVKGRHDFFSSMASYPELFMELSKQLRIKEFVSLYAISRDFHEIINGHLSHCLRACAECQAPESSEIFVFKFYSSLCITDPASRPHPVRSDEVRKVPSLRWLQMVIHREKTVRDILACMARKGHRMPKTMSLSLKKMWLLMDVATSAGRVQLMHSKLFRDVDLYNIQLFIVKLDMRFNDPIDGPGDESLRKLFLGQRGLTPLCKLLKREICTSLVDVVKLCVRYAYNVRPEHQHMPVWDIPPEEIGVGHLEGWGAGRIHLVRPDEIVVRESVRRRLDLKNHIMGMMLWGYVDPITAENIKVTDEEKYMSDDEEKPRHAGWNDYIEPESQDSEDDDEDGESDGVEDEGEYMIDAED